MLKLSEIGAHAAAPGVPNASRVLTTRFGAVVTEWSMRLDLDAAAIQC